MTEQEVLAKALQFIYLESLELYDSDSNNRYKEFWHGRLDAIVEIAALLKYDILDKSQEGK